MSDDQDLKGLFSRMLETPQPTRLNRDDILAAGRRARLRRRVARVGAGSVIAAAVLALGTVTASALHGPSRSGLSPANSTLASGPALPNLPALPVPAVSVPALPAPTLPLPAHAHSPSTSSPSLGAPGLPTGLLGAPLALPALPGRPTTLSSGPQLARARQLLSSLLATLPTPIRAPSLAALPGANGLAQTASAQAFRYANGSYAYHAQSDTYSAGRSGMVAVDAYTTNAAEPTGDLCRLAVQRLAGEAGCKLVTGAGGKVVRLSWVSASGAQVYRATAFFRGAVVTVLQSTGGVSPSVPALTGPVFGLDRLAGLAASGQFKP